MQLLILPAIPASGAEVLIISYTIPPPCHEFPSASWRQKSPAIRLFVKTNNKANIKAPHYWPSVKEIHRCPGDSLHKGPALLKPFPCHNFLIRILPGGPPLSSYAARGPGCWNSGYMSSVNQSQGVLLPNDSAYSSERGRNEYRMSLGMAVGSGKEFVKTKPPHIVLSNVGSTKPANSAAPSA